MRGFDASSGEIVEQHSIDILDRATMDTLRRQPSVIDIKRKESELVFFNFRAF